MTARVLLGSLLATIVLMVWGFICWGLLSDQLGIVSRVADEPALMNVLDQALPESGVYFFPVDGWDSADQAIKGEWTRRHTEGPMGMIFLNNPGVAPSPLVFLKGFLHYFVSTLLAAGILLFAQRAVPRYGQRVTLVVLIALFAVVLVALSPSIWWYHPWSYSLYLAVTTVIGWFLAGLVLAYFVKPESQYGVV